MEKKYHIEKNTVQETLIIHLIPATDAAQR